MFKSLIHLLHICKTLLFLNKLSAPSLHSLYDRLINVLENKLYIPSLATPISYTMQLFSNQSGIHAVI